MVSAPPPPSNDQKYPRYPLVLKSNVTLLLRFVILYFFIWKILSDDGRLYLHDSKLNSRSDVDGLTHTKQLLNLLCKVDHCLHEAIEFIMTTRKTMSPHVFETTLTHAFIQGNMNSFKRNTLCGVLANTVLQSTLPKTYFCSESRSSPQTCVVENYCFYFSTKT